MRAPHCVVLDLNMPELSGFDVLEALRTSAHDVPVVVVTGEDTLESFNRAMKLGAAAYLTKPVDDENLLNAISAALHHSEGSYRATSR
jgi:FixJ family two-component response regulator